LERLESTVNQEHKDHKVLRDLQGPPVHLERLACLVIQDRVGLLERMELLAQLVCREQVDRPGHLVLKVRPATQEHLVHPERLDPRDQLGHLVVRARRDFPEMLERLETPDLVVHQEHLESKALAARRDHQAILGHLELRDFLECKVSRVHQERRVPRALRVHRDLRDR